MRKLLALVVLVLVGVMSEAQATIGSGQWLHDGWGSARKVDKSSTDYALAFEYEGFVLGATRVMLAARWIAIPATVSVGKWLAVVGKYLDANPEKRNLAESLVYQALYAVWPGEKTP
jgi:hypothetical protein